MRALLCVLDEQVPDWRTKQIFEAAGDGPASDMIRRNAAGYISSHFYPGREPGTTQNGHRVEDLQRLTFPDESFDLVVTQDVFEHVLRPDAAFAEIARVLRPGGAHVFTVPIWPSPATVVRARARADGGVEHLLPAEYHGDPVSQRSLVVTDWSPDIADYIQRHSGLPSQVLLRRDRSLGLDGEHLDVVISWKPVPSADPAPTRRDRRP
jgi:SAM-dependent methyltransferase